MGSDVFTYNRVFTVSSVPWDSQPVFLPHEKPPNGQSVHGIKPVLMANQRERVVSRSSCHFLPPVPFFFIRGWPAWATLWHRSRNPQLKMLNRLRILPDDSGIRDRLIRVGRWPSRSHRAAPCGSINDLASHFHIHAHVATTSDAISKSSGMIREKRTR